MLPAGDLTLQASQFQKGGAARVFFGGGIMPSNNVGRALPANNTEPQEVFTTLMRRNPGVIGGLGNLHTLTFLLRTLNLAGRTYKAVAVAGFAHRTGEEHTIIFWESLSAILPSGTALWPVRNVKTMLKNTCPAPGASLPERPLFTIT